MKKVLVMSVVFATLVWTMGLASFVPAASAATLSAGDLIKGSGPAVYYYAADGKRYTFPTLSTYMTWYSDFSTVKTITDSELAAISLAGNVVVRAGTKLVKIDTVPKVFAVEPKGKLIWINSEAAAATLYGADWNKRIIVIPDGFWTNYTDSGLTLDGTRYPEGQLVKWAGSTDVYYVTATQKLLVSAAAMTANMFKAADVVTAPASITMTSGTGITGAVSTYIDVSQGGGAGATLPTGTGTLTVSLAGDTPAASPVADAATANFVKFGLTANGAAINVNRVVLTKGGYSANGDVENVKITDLSGVPLTNSGSLNSNGSVSLAFSPALSLAAGETRYFYVRAGVVNNTTSGKTVSFAVSASADVYSTAAAVAGNFPVQGNAMSVVNVDIGSAKVYQDGTVTDSTPDAGDENVVVNRFKVEAGTVEAITIESMSLLEAGSASLSDVKNIELWSVTQNKSLGEVAAYSANGKVSFGNLNIVIAKGESHRFQVRLDIVSGAGETVNTDLVDGTDVLMSVKGNAYGFYITPSDILAWGGQGSSNQTINAGTLNISKASTTPATGKIAEAADQALVIWELEARGEPIRVTNFTVDVALGDNDEEGDLIACKLFDASGAIVAGPVDAIADGTEAQVVFTDTFIVPVGTSKYTFKCRMFDSTPDDWAGGDSFTASVTPSTGITAKGDNTNDTVSFASQATPVAGNTMTVATVALAMTTLGTPAAQSVAAGAGDFVWATFSLDASGSGENVNVTSLEITDTIGGGGLVTDIDNVEVWCDLTSSSSERGDIYEKKVTNTENFSTAALAIDLTETVVVNKNAFVKCAVVADLNSGAANPETHQVNLTDVTASGADTGAEPTPVIAGNGQVMSVAGTGVLTVSVDASSPKSAIFVSGESKQTVAVFRLTADSVEALDLDEFMITNNGNDNAVLNYYFYSSKRSDSKPVTDPIATKPGAGTARAIIDDGIVTVPASSYVLITVKADLALVDGTTVDNGATVIADVTDASTDVLTTGLSSGDPVVGAAKAYTPETQYVYEARPVITKDSSSPSGPLNNEDAALVAVFKIDNSNGTKDIVMDADNTLKVTFSGSATAATCDGDGTTTGCTVTLKDASGDVLGSDITVDLGSGVSGAASIATVTFSDSTPLRVSAGSYELIKVYANTLDFTTAGNSLKVKLEETAGNFTWSIDSLAGDNAEDVYSTAAITLRGTVEANVLGK